MRGHLDGASQVCVVACLCALLTAGPFLGPALLYGSVEERRHLLAHGSIVQPKGRPLSLGGAYVGMAGGLAMALGGVGMWVAVLAVLAMLASGT
jgi:hypothetical protein